MARIKVNLNEIPDGFEVMEPGKYSAKLFDVEESESAKGNPMLVWTWVIDRGEYLGKEIKSFTSLQEHALFGLKEHLEAFGLSGELDFDTDKLLNKKVVLTVSKSKTKSRKTGEDIEVNRVDAVSQAKAGRAKPQIEISDDDDPPF